MFRFRLQRVLELREKHEQAQAIALAKAEDVAAAARGERQQLQALHAASRERMSSAQSTGVTVGSLQQLGFVLNAVDQRVAHAAQTVAAAESVASDARSALEVAARDRRVLDRLKEKHLEVFRAEESQRDRVAMDEVALGRFTRQRGAAQRDQADALAEAVMADRKKALSQSLDGATDTS